MLLLDVSKEPTNTVYYISAVSYGILKDNDGLDCSSLYKAVAEKIMRPQLNYDFFVMSLDFLFLLDKVMVDNRGELHVH